MSGYLVVKFVYDNEGSGRREKTLTYYAKKSDALRATCEYEVAGWHDDIFSNSKKWAILEALQEQGLFCCYTFRSRYSYVFLHVLALDNKMTNIFDDFYTRKAINEEDLDNDEDRPNSPVIFENEVNEKDRAVSPVIFEHEVEENELEEEEQTTEETGPSTVYLYIISSMKNECEPKECILTVTYFEEVEKALDYSLNYFDYKSKKLSRRLLSDGLVRWHARHQIVEIWNSRKISFDYEDLSDLESDY